MKITNRHYPFSERCQNLPSSFIRDILKVASEKEVISFAGGLPDPGLFPLHELESCTSTIFKKYGTSLLQYSKSDGWSNLKKWICDHYKNEFDMTIIPEQILVTNGSQQALDLIGKAFINKGDNIILEQPSYLGAIQAFMAYEPIILPVPIQIDGINLEALEKLLIQHKPKLLYLVSNFQNPSGITISEEKRKLLAMLAERYDVIIAEDDPYGMLRYDGASIKPIRSHCHNTILCGSFSKIIAPGLRMGWIIADEEIIRKLLVLKQATDLHCNNFSQLIIENYLTTFSLEEHLTSIRSTYGKKRNLMYNAIKDNFPLKCEVIYPEGGMFIWVSLPEHIDTEILLAHTLKENVIFVPGKYFFTNGTGQNTMRLNFTNSAEEDIEHGIRVIGRKIIEVFH